MANHSYTAVFEKAEDGTWSGYVPDLLMVLGTGKSRVEAVADLRVALELWVEDMKARKLAIPMPTAEIVSIEVAA